MIGRDLASLRQRLGWTTVEMGRRMGCSQQRIWAVENRPDPVPAAWENKLKAFEKAARILDAAAAEGEPK